ncbi:hypothetical protein ACS0TY_023396 [Phlomoides rotata]
MSNTNVNLTLFDKNKIAQFLIANSSNGAVHYGKVGEAVGMFGEQMLEGIPVNLISKKKGIPKKKRLQLDVDLMKSIAFEKRSTIRRLARELGMSKSHVCRLVKEGVIRAYTNAIKPELTEKNKQGSNSIIPAIKAKWPSNASKNIIIQQDNAKPHISNNDPDFRLSDLLMQARTSLLTF